MYHREMYPPDEEFWRNYNWKDFTIRERRYFKLKARRSLRSKVKQFKIYLNEYGYKVYGPVAGFKYVTVWYAEKK